MTAERFRQIEELFHTTAERPPAERLEFLKQACAGDTELCAEVEALLAEAEGGGKHIEDLIGREASRFAEDAGPQMLERRLGPYRLVRELGHGGMGAVYLALRDDDEYKTAVAIKLLHRGLETATAVARFRGERQILATLDHAGIVRLLDGGRTEDGLPYLVMEHVEGAPITQHAQAANLSVAARVELFRKVCEAVAYAHQKLVVHRDIKPSNILVMADGTPKLLDFGIAKLLDPEAEAEQEARTRTGMRLLTPEYASPEQVRGEPVTTAADVYSLGAVLYELLTDVPAHRITGEGIPAILAVLEVDPPRPSAVAPVDRRRALAGDLDNIVQRALEKEPAHRYASVEQLAEDLRRHREGLPVVARAGTFGYRAGKLIKRNRGLIAVLGLLLVTLSTATGVSVRQARRADEQARRAQRRFADVRRLANSMLFEVDEKIQHLEGSTAARELIVSRALEYLDDLAAEASDDVALARELSTAYMKIGDVQGNNLVANLGRPQDGLASYAKAKQILERLYALGHRDAVTRWSLARALYGTGFLHRAIGDQGAARANILAAEALVSSFPANDSFDYRLLAQGHAVMVSLEAEASDMGALMRHVEASLAVATQWMRADGSLEARYWLSVAHISRFEALLLSGDPEGAIGAIGEAGAILASLSAEHPENASYRRELWLYHMLNAMVLSGSGDLKIWVPCVGDVARAERELEDALRLVDFRMKAESGDMRVVLESVWNLDALATIVAERDPAAALPLFQRARERFMTLPVAVRESSYTRQNERFGQCAMAVSLAKQGRRADALAAMERGLALASKDEAEGELDLRIAPWACRYQAAKARRALGDTAEALRLLDAVAVGLRSLIAARPSALMLYVGFADTLEFLAELRTPERCELLGQAAAVWQSWPGAKTAYTQRRQAELDAALSRCRTRR